ncbi:hypothetical protein J6590_024724 [Homalodisca vitripennis]|nr:hypothetical protein J6590_024724 [Homalodisca vitripennis]
MSVHQLKRYVHLGFCTVRPLYPLYMRWGVTKLQVADLAGAQFERSGSVNNQPTPRRERNSRSIDNANSHEVHQVAVHPQKVTVRCGFWAGGVIGPYFFENNVGGALLSTANASEQL